MSKKIAGKLLVAILTIALLVSAVLIPGTVTTAEGELEGEATSATFDEWDGTIGVVPSDTDGDGVVEVNTAEEFAAVIKTGGANGVTYKLTKDIYLNPEGSFNWADGTAAEGATLNSWISSGKIDGRFKGTFDGDGHVVYGLYSKAEKQNTAFDWSAVALFPSISSNAVIKNIGLEDSYIFAQAAAGGIVGLLSSAVNTLVESCYVSETVYLNGYQVGGIVSTGNEKTDIRNCYVLATIEGPNAEGRNGGLLGNCWGGANFENVYTSFEKANGTGNISGNDWYMNIKDPASVTSWTLGDAYYYPENGYPRLKIFDETERNNLGVWSGTASTPDDGSGINSSDPFIIKTAAELYYMISNGTETYKVTVDTVEKTYSKVDGKYAKLVNDIIINDINVQIEDGVGVIYDANGEKLDDTSSLRQWFTTQGKTLSSATIDGNNHVIRGLYFDTDSGATVNQYSKGLGLVNKAWNVTFKNIGIEDMWARYLNGSVAAFVGTIQSQTGNVIDHCYVGEDVYITGYNAAGLFGGGAQTVPTTAQTVKDSYVLGKIVGTNKTGAVTGDIWSCGSSTVTNFYSTTKIFGNNNMSVTNVYGAYTVGDYTSPAVTATNGKGAVTDGNALYLGDEFHYVENDYPKLKCFTGYDAEWNGLGDNVLSGTGTIDDPFMVTNVGELAYMVNCFNSSKQYYKLANDIDVNDLSKIDWATGIPEAGYKPICWFEGTKSQGNAYTGAGGTLGWWQGHFDGNGHTVRGIWYPADTKTTIAGLVPVVANADISNLIVDSSYIVTDRFGGTVSGWADGASSNVTFDKIYVGSDVTLTSSTATETYESCSVGGVTGYINKAVTLNNCGFNGKISEKCSFNSNRKHGLVGTYWSSTININGCYSIGISPSHASGSTSAGTVTIKNSYYDVADANSSVDAQYTNLTTEQMTGADALENMTGLDGSVWVASKDDTKAPLLRMAHVIGDVNLDGVFELATDAAALRQFIIGDAVSEFADINGDTVIDIFDLVALYLI